MKMRRDQFRCGILGASSCALLTLIFAQAAVAADAPAAGLVPLDLKLPFPVPVSTRLDIPTNSITEPYRDAKKDPRPPIMVPAGLTNLAAGAKATCSDKSPTPDMLAKIVDGDKEASDESSLCLRKGLQWVELDLGGPKEIFAIVLWHTFNVVKHYHGVVVQIADDENFTRNVQTVFNNDQENAAGLGIGTDREYYETHEGKLISVKGLKGRYVRTYSKGSSESALNEYTEIEVYGRPAK
jgi:hypothetical protein